MRTAVGEPDVRRHIWPDATAAHGGARGGAGKGRPSCVTVTRLSPAERLAREAWQGGADVREL